MVALESIGLIVTSRQQKIDSRQRVGFDALRIFSASPSAQKEAVL
jgi:hypothetical protein